MPRLASRKALLVAAILVAALAIRVANVEATSYKPQNDALFYLRLAKQIAHTGDYSTSTAPGSGAGGTRGPSAYFPPAFPYLLAGVDLLTGHTAPKAPATVEPARLSQAALGTVTVALVGLVAFEAFGAETAILALGLAAIYPVFVAMSSVLAAENLLTAFVLAAVWAALRARSAERPYRWIALAGLLAGLGALTHINGILIVIPLLVATWAGRRHLKRPAVLLAVTVLTIAPWTIRNALTMHHFILVSDETGVTLVGTYNAASAADEQVPYKWRIYSTIPGVHLSTAVVRRLTEPQLSSKLEHQALTYIGHHPLAPLAVAYDNTRRLFELEGSFAWRASAYSIGIGRGAATLGVIGFWVITLLAIAGALTRTARRAPWWLWLTPVLFALSIVFVNVETPRFREPIDPFLIVLASCALTSLLERLRRAPIRRHRRPAGPAGTGQLVNVVERLA